MKIAMISPKVVNEIANDMALERYGIGNDIPRLAYERDLRPCLHLMKKVQALWEWQDMVTGMIPYHKDCGLIHSDP